MRYYAFMDLFDRHLHEARDLYTGLPENTTFAASLQRAGEAVVQVLAKGGTVLIAGNGGSAAEAQHLSAEIVGRYKKERRGLPSIALTTDTSILTAVGNDYSFDDIFARQVEALGRPGDLLVLLSTSGNSQNLVRAAERAKALSVVTVALLGKTGGTLAPLVDIPIIVPSDDTPRIQEVHLLIIHAISELIDERCS